MKKTTQKMKALMLTLAMALGMLLPTTMNAQSDGFFRGDNDGDQYRTETGFGNETFGANDNYGPYTTNDVAPLGGGMMILVAAGAGYIALKKKED